MAESTSTVKPKRRRTVLSIEDKVAIIKQLESSSANVIAERYDIGKDTVSDIKKKCDKILRFNQEMRNMGISKKVKVMKVGDDEQPKHCLLYTSPSPRDRQKSRMPSSA